MDGISIYAVERKPSPVMHVMAVEPERRYYFADGNIYILVEDTTYKVHRHFFKHYSSTFRSMFSLPSPDGVATEGLTADNPIRLEGEKSSDFERLLGIFYPRKYSSHDHTSVEEWTSVLSLAIKWEFDCIRDLAIDRLFPITSPIDKIVPGRKHYDDLKRWLGQAFTDICIRNDPLNLEEGRRLGIEDIIHIGEVRHLIRHQQLSMNQSHGRFHVLRIFQLPQSVGQELRRKLEDILEI